MLSINNAMLECTKKKTGKMVVGKCDLLLTGEGGPGSSSGTTAGWSLNAAENKEELLLRLRNPVVCDMGWN